MISGIVLSRHVFAFAPQAGGYELAQQVHILCAYWGFVCIEPASGVSLEHDAGDGAQTLAAFIHANMEPATDRLALGSVWCVRFPTQRR